MEIKTVTHIIVTEYQQVTQRFPASRIALTVYEFKFIKSKFQFIFFWDGGVR